MLVSILNSSSQYLIEIGCHMEGVLSPPAAYLDPVSFLNAIKILRSSRKQLLHPLGKVIDLVHCSRLKFIDDVQ